MRKRRAQTTVSLFPFLSILACVIGTLTLVIAALALRQVVSDLSSHQGTASPALALAEARAARAALEHRRAVHARTQGQVRVLREMLESRGIDPDADQDELDSLAAQRAKDEQATAQLPQLRAELEAVERAVSNANAHVEHLGLTENSDAKRISLQPSGSGTPLLPYFVECRRDAVLLHAHESGRRQPLQLDDPADAARFSRFLTEVRKRGDSTLIFLIRPSGVQSYRRAVKRAEAANIRHGKLALPSDGDLDFSLL